jgi:hypothetical protein
MVRIKPTWCRLAVMTSAPSATQHGNLAMGFRYSPTGVSGSRGEVDR